MQVSTYVATYIPVVSTLSFAISISTITKTHTSSTYVHKYITNLHYTVATYIRISKKFEFKKEVGIVNQRKQEL